MSHRGYIRKQQGVPAAFCQSHRKKLVLHNGISTTVPEGDLENSSKKLAHGGPQGRQPHTSTV